ncbi:MAG: CDP-alcohol phosphatidyltransferase family protein [Actinomycetes bacterium]|jgi:CDP-diacylglycerol---glycerol-3-phosphate 3-phosphatidyltransferase
MSSRAPGERREAMREALIESRLTPNAISLTGFALCLVAAGLIFADMIVLGGIAYIIGSICDTLDGRYSRMSGKGSPFGAFLDSTLDRVEEGVVLAAVAYNFAQQGKGVEAAICAVAILASVMVSYTRARAEALGVECKVGIGSRATRVVILSVGLLFANGLGLGDFSLLAPAVTLLAAIGIVTTLQRIFHVRGKLLAAGRDSGNQ